MALAALAGCKNNTQTNQENPEQKPETENVATQEPEAQETPLIDHAQNVLKLIDRSLIPERINDSIYMDATVTVRPLDDVYVSPYSISAMNGEGGIYNIVYVDLLPRTAKDYFVLFYTEAGVDGSVTDLVKTYIYNPEAGTLNEIPVEEQFAPFNVNEMFEGVTVPDDLKLDYKELVKNYAGKKGFKGFDIRLTGENRDTLEVRPSSIGFGEFWDLVKPVKYAFNGEGFVKVK